MRSPGFLLMLTLIGLGFSAAQGTAQITECTYSTCALRIQSSFFGGRSLVRIADDERVVGLRFPIRSLDEVFAGSEEAQGEARTFQQRENLGGAFLLLGGIAGIVSLSQLDFEPFSESKKNPTPWAFAGLGLGGAGLITILTGRGHIRRAVDLYNDALPR